MREQVVSPIHWITIGGGTNDDATRRIRPDILNRGADRLDELLRESWGLGYRRVVLHNWYGTIVGEDMQFDQYWHARKANTDGKFDRLLNSSNFRRVVNKWVAAGMEVIAYVGTMRQDPDFKNIERSQTDNLLYRIYMSLRMFMDAGCSIAFDVANDAQPAKDTRGVTYGVMLILDSLGVPVYQEPAAPADNNTANWPSIVVEPRYDYMASAYYKHEWRWHPEQNIVIVKGSDHTPPDPYHARPIEDQIKKASELVKEGFTPAMTSTVVRVSDYMV